MKTIRVILFFVGLIIFQDLVPTTESGLEMPVLGSTARLNNDYHVLSHRAETCAAQDLKDALNKHESSIKPIAAEQYAKKLMQAERSRAPQQKNNHQDPLDYGDWWADAAAEKLTKEQFVAEIAP